MQQFAFLCKQLLKLLLQLLRRLEAEPAEHFGDARLDDQQALLPVRVLVVPASWPNIVLTLVTVKYL